ncbi:hypothetical protein SNOG_04474 [Parastagonospora nodorum SN15]|uniref:Rhodopsin domain-containing protein n=1 Tax=Phaeosphaeria nodorum (strain SN15 / ATCC MYA-4574 / FGSC 10173) TaxID=321614 RepID=Q0UUU0_PHANO|nr:hypothetical protein SNOG_04474 [Parastagonospora nodorum SN15]EAT88234.2 hypothetical protein SNOG_04474 [Parastagonospora nodorum SN15]
MALPRTKFATHMWDISIAHTMSDEFLIPSFFLNWPTALVWAFAKTSFFLMYLDLFSPVKWLRIGCYVGIIVNWGFYIAVIAASLYYNAPSPGQTWLEGSQNPRYAGSFNMTMPIASGSLILDVYILLLPVWVVWNLHLNLTRRLGVIAIFATGLFCCVASSLSIVYKHKLNGKLGDFTWWTYPILLMALVEMCVGISASCMPATAAFWRHVFGQSSENPTGRSLWASRIFMPIRSLVRSKGSSHYSKNSSGSSWARQSSHL